MPPDIPSSKGGSPESVQAPETVELAEGSEEQNAVGGKISDDLEEVVELRVGDALTRSEASQIMGSSRTQMLVIAGAVESGKTTLIASLFHLFQKGPFAGYCFAGSHTLVGFDMRCHMARIASDRSAAHMPRTNPKEDRIFLHLRVRAENMDRPVKDLLISDLSGEHYRDAKDSIEDCQKLGLISRADHFILLIDGEKLISLDKRQAAKAEATMLLRCCVNAKQLGTSSLVDVLFTKWDLIENSDDKPEHEQFASLIQESLAGQFGSRVGRLRFSKVVALRVLGKYPVGYGLDRPFPSWVEESAASVLPERHVLVEPDSLTEFDRYLKRWLPRLFTEA